MLRLLADENLSRQILTGLVRKNPRIDIITALEGDWAARRTQRCLPGRPNMIEFW
jgi:hypothetical protein